jgi:hypothetical protein
MDQQIAALRAALAAVESSIVNTQSALNNATIPQDIAALRSILIDLKAERARLQFQLVNLEAAAVEVAPLGVPPTARALTRRGAASTRKPAPRRAAMRAVEKELMAAVADRTVAQAALALAQRVLASARKLRDSQGEEPTRIASKRNHGRTKTKVRRRGGRRGA